MQFSGKLTEADLSDVRRLTRSKIYWPKFFLANWYATALFLMIMYLTISGFLGLTTPNWSGVAVIWGVLMVIVSWAVYRTKRAQARELTKLNATAADSINLTSDGVKWDGPNGATGFLPWRNFKGWREGNRVVLVDQGEGDRFVMLPAGNCPKSSACQFDSSYNRTSLALASAMLALSFENAGWHCSPRLLPCPKTRLRETGISGALLL